MIRIAISTTEPLRSESLALLQRIGVGVPMQVGCARARTTNFPAEVLFVAESDMTVLVNHELADLAIVGRHYLEEQPFANVQELRSLNIARCKVALVATTDKDKNGEAHRQNMVATVFPTLFDKQMKQSMHKAKVLHTHSSRQLVQAGLVDYSFEAVPQTEDLESQHLCIAEKLKDSSAVLVGNTNNVAHTQLITDELLLRLDAALSAENKRLVSMHVHGEHLADILKVLPCTKKTSVINLTDDVCLVQSVMDEVRFWDVVSTLKELHAEDIVVTPIDKMIF